MDFLWNLLVHICCSLLCRMYIFVSKHSDRRERPVAHADFALYICSYLPLGLKKSSYAAYNVLKYTL